MDAAQGIWRKVSVRSHHDLHHTMAYDRRRGLLFVFGDYRPTREIWSYRPGATAGEAGAWSRHLSTSEPSPPLSAVPVAYAASQDVFVLVVDDAEPGPPPRSPARSASTYFYDPESETCKRLGVADLPPIGMNFMMAWHPNLELVFLVTGDWRGTVTVWAMRPRK
jgi:hypothetical protein